MDYSCLQSKYLIVPAVKYFDCYIKIDGSNFSFIKSKFKYKLNMNGQILIKWPWCFYLGFINRWTCNMKIIQFSFNNSDSQTIMTSTFFLTRTPHIFKTVSSPFQVLPTWNQTDMAVVVLPYSNSPFCWFLEQGHVKVWLKNPKKLSMLRLLSNLDIEDLSLEESQLCCRHMIW